MYAGHIQQVKQNYKEKSVRVYIYIYIYSKNFGHMLEKTKIRR